MHDLRIWYLPEGEEKAIPIVGFENLKGIESISFRFEDCTPEPEPEYDQIVDIQEENLTEIGEIKKECHD